MSQARKKMLEQIKNKEESEVKRKKIHIKTKRIQEEPIEFLYNKFAYYYYMYYICISKLKNKN